MQVTVALFGLARQLTGARAATVSVREGATLREVALALGELYPQLVGPIIKAQVVDLESPYVFSLHGQATPPSLDYVVRDEDRLVLMFVPAGG
ncbi:MAG: MoaD/ThiS family protein [Chloroflexota bacterium]